MPGNGPVCNGRQQPSAPEVVKTASKNANLRKAKLQQGAGLFKVVNLDECDVNNNKDARINSAELDKGRVRLPRVDAADQARVNALKERKEEKKGAGSLIIAKRERLCAVNTPDHQYRDKLRQDGPEVHKATDCPTITPSAK